MTKNKEFIQARIDSIVASSMIMVHDDDDDVEIRDRYQRTLMSGRKVPRYREHPSNTHIFQQVKKDHRHTKPMFCEVCLHRYRRDEDSTVDFNSCHCISESDRSNISKNNTMNPNNRFGVSHAEQEYGADERFASATAAGSRQKKRAPIPCNYEEEHVNGHTSVWGSYFFKGTLKWGYADDHSLVKSSYGTGINGRIANDESNESTYDGSGTASTRKTLQVIPNEGSNNTNSEKDKPNAQSKLYGEANDQPQAFDKEKLTAEIKLQEESELGDDEEVVLEVDECLAEPVIDVKQLEAKTKKKKNLALGVDEDNAIHEHKSKAFRRNAFAIVAFLLVVVIICICLLFTFARPRKTPLG